jgi:hypothetical protein
LRGENRLRNRFNFVGSNGDFLQVFDFNGAPRPMKMGTTASPWRYDAAAHHALQPANLRRPAILHFASCADDQQSGSARCTQTRTFMFDLDLHGVNVAVHAVTAF